MVVADISFALADEVDTGEFTKVVREIKSQLFVCRAIDIVCIV